MINSGNWYRYLLRGVVCQWDLILFQSVSPVRLPTAILKLFKHRNQYVIRESLRLTNLIEPIRYIPRPCKYFCEARYESEAQRWRLEQPP